MQPCSILFSRLARGQKYVGLAFSVCGLKGPPFLAWLSRNTADVHDGQQKICAAVTTQRPQDLEQLIFTLGCSRQGRLDMLPHRIPQ